MNILVDLVAALAWPLTVLVLGLLFRSELRGVIRRLSHVKYKDIEASFEGGLGEAEERARELPAATKEPQLQPPESEEHERVIRLAEVSPRAAVVEAWREVELATERASRAADLPVQGRVVGTRSLRQLVERNLVHASLIPVYDQLRRLRNQAVHAEEFAINESEAERYAELARTIVRALGRVGGQAA